MTRYPTEFKEFLRSLNANGVRYLVVGGYAVGFHGHPRATGDLDVWIAPKRENAERAVQAMADFGFSDDSLTPEHLMDPDTIVRMGMPPLRIEVLTAISGVEFESCYRDRVRATMDDVEADLIGLEALRTNKKAAGRHKDLDDLEHLA